MTTTLPSRSSLNRSEAALLTVLLERAGDHDGDASRLLERLEASSSRALRPLLEALSELNQDELKTLNETWRVLDARGAAEAIRERDEQSARHLSAHLDERWARALFALRAHDPAAASSSPGVLALSAEVLAADLQLEPSREDLDPAQPSGEASVEGFDLASFQSWSSEEIVVFAKRLGYTLLARSLKRYDRRALARQLHALTPQARAWVLEDMKDEVEVDDALVKRADEVLIALDKRAPGDRDALMILLGLYLFAVAAGRRRADRAFELAERLTYPYAQELHGFVRQHRTSSRRGLEPHAVHAITSLLERLSSPPSEPSP